MKSLTSLRIYRRPTRNLIGRRVPRFATAFARPWPAFITPREKCGSIFVEQLGQKNDFPLKIAKTLSIRDKKTLFHGYRPNGASRSRQLSSCGPCCRRRIVPPGICTARFGTRWFQCNDCKDCRGGLAAVIKS